jgi:hypothetical protein
MNHLAGVVNAFVAKIGAGGSPLVYSTYFGGTNSDQGNGIAVDAAGEACVTGFTDSTNFPTTTNGVIQVLNNFATASFADDAFVAKFAASFRRPTPFSPNSIQPEPSFIPRSSAVMPATMVMAWPWIRGARRLSWAPRLPPISRRPMFPVC